uniref:Growth-regulating factor n=1 Tax=Zea mays TaxID=4577 RepID=B6TCS2_MAIZE|nr:growth-regulating factor [Zea mays]
MGMAMPFASPSPAADHRPSSLLPFCRAAPLSAAGEDAAQQHAMSGRWAARPALFTAAQYEELEHQALIYKYLVAGVPVPPDLLLPLRRGFVFHQPPALGYGPYFGKKVDPEPGRCRRTDGKKWRCSKEAAPDSKYCERHMHRGRNRSRKPVEAQLAPPPHAQPPQQQQAPAPAAGFQNHSLYPSILNGNGGGGLGAGAGGGTFGLGPTSQLHMDSAAAYATAAGGGSKYLRYSAYGVKSLSDEHSTLLSGGMDPSMMDNSWRLLPSQNNTFQATSYPVFGTLSGLDESTIASLPKTQREPLSFFGSDFVTAAKQENQTLRPFFDEWPKSRDSWPELGEDSSLGFSATQLSISIPMATSDFSNTSSRSPGGIPSR